MKNGKKRRPKKLVVIGGTSNPELFSRIAIEIAKHRGYEDFSLCDVKISNFADGEWEIKINPDSENNLRGKDVYILQTTYPHGMIEQLLLLIDACIRASAQSVKLVIPYFGYSRADRKVEARTPISASCIARIFEEQGVNRIMAIDLHAGQIQGFVRIPFDNLFARYTFIRFLKKNLGNVLNDCLLISPDAGGIPRVKSYAKRLNLPFSSFEKSRGKANEIESMKIGELYGKKTAIIIDDLIDTGGTICKAVNMLADNGMQTIYAMMPHALLSKDPETEIEAVEKIEASAITKLFVGNTIPLRENARQCAKIETVCLAELLAKAILRDFRGRSVNYLFT